MNIDLSVIIAIVALGISVASFAYNLSRNRKSIFLTIDSLCTYLSSDENIKQVLLSATFENRSHQPISVTAVDLHSCDSSFRVGSNAQLLFRFSDKINGKVIREREICSRQFPINISPLCSEHGYFSLVLSPDIEIDLSKPQNFLIYTNRGKVSQTISGLSKALLPRNKFLSPKSR